MFFPDTFIQCVMMHRGHRRWWDGGAFLAKGVSGCKTPTQLPPEPSVYANGRVVFNLPMVPDAHQFCAKGRRMCSAGGCLMPSNAKC